MTQFIKDEWVENESVGPRCNIYRREWMTKDGEMFGTYYGPGSIPQKAMLRGILWRFPGRVPARKEDY